MVRGHGGRERRPCEFMACGKAASSSGCTRMQPESAKRTAALQKSWATKGTGKRGKANADSSSDAGRILLGMTVWRAERLEMSAGE